MRYRQLVPFISVAALSMVAAAAAADEDVSPSPCRSVSGTYLIRGTQQEASLPPKEIVYLERLLDPRLKAVADHFSFTFNARFRRVEITVFDEQSQPVYTYNSGADYMCRGGVLMRETRMQGGSEGCSKSMVITTQVAQSEDGLRFDSVETGKYGATCMTPDTEVHRVTTFARYRP